MGKMGTSRLMCHNCHYETYVLRDECGFAEMQCPCCGAKITMKMISRRHVQIDVYAPKGQVVLRVLIRPR